MTSVKVVVLQDACMACFAIGRMRAHSEFTAEQAADMSTVVALANVKVVGFDEAVGHLCEHHRHEYNKLLVRIEPASS